MVSLSGIRHLFFDLDDTLWDFEKNSARALTELFYAHELATKLNSSAPEFVHVYHRINLELWHQLYRGEIDKTYLRRERFTRVFLHFNYRNTALSAQLSQLYLQIAPLGTHLKPHCKEVLAGLQQKFQLHIITNGFAESQNTKLDTCGLREYFHTIIISEEHGAVKPETKIFRIAEQLTEAQPGQCLMIGDNFESDIKGALNAGWQAIHFTQEIKDKPATEQIQSLSELLYKL